MYIETWNIMHKTSNANGLVYPPIRMDKFVLVSILGLYWHVHHQITFNQIAQLHLRYTSIIQLHSIIKHLYLISVWATSSTFMNFSTLNSEHNWEDLCICSKYQQTCTSHSHNYIRGGPNFNPIFVDASSCIWWCRTTQAKEQRLLLSSTPEDVYNCWQSFRPLGEVCDLFILLDLIRSVPVISFRELHFKQEKNIAPLEVLSTLKLIPDWCKIVRGNYHIRAYLSFIQHWSP